MKKYINRSILMIVPKTPFYEWAESIFPGDPESPDDEGLAYLLDDEWDSRDIKRYLKKNYDEVFTEFLYSIVNFPEAWPEPLTWAMFQQWFDWHYSSIVWDTLPKKRLFRETL